MGRSVDLDVSLKARMPESHSRHEADPIDITDKALRPLEAMLAPILVLVTTFEPELARLSLPFLDKKRLQVEGSLAPEGRAALSGGRGRPDALLE